jgi:transcriptional regulator with GAF, ATPase, and Fis domain
MDGGARAAFNAVTAAFASLGRVCLALDGEYRIRHVSEHLDEVLGPGAAAHFEGRSAAELLGSDLFGADGALRAALEAGERREGWRAVLPAHPQGKPASVTVAPLRHLGAACDPGVAYLVVLRPANEETCPPTGPDRSPTLVAHSPSMQEVLRLVDSIRRSDVSVLLGGETGVGKGLVAQAIHAASARRMHPLVSVNCAALPETLLETELFGHVRGAFTGALRDRAGRFEVADRGTLFLDEVGDLPLHVQAKLLRVLQERTFERVGDSRSITVDVRVIAATHRDLRREVAAGRFREDLLYRLRVFPIEIPPLRDRREDIEPLAVALLARSVGRTGRDVRLSPAVVQALLAYPWYGNVRELENALEYAATVATGQTLQPEDLPREIVCAARSGAPLARCAAPSRLDSRRRPAPSVEALRAALDTHLWRMNDTARALSVSRSTLWRWMRELRLDR